MVTERIATAAMIAVGIAVLVACALAVANGYLTGA
jgi:hypothetical protein